MTQPALSMQIRELETDLGVGLVERRPGEVILTEVGAEVARRAERVLAATRDLDRLRPPQRAAADRTAAARRHPDRLRPMCCRKSCRRCSSAIPELRVELRETQTHTLIDELVRGALDVVLLALPVDEAEIETLALFDDPFLLAVPAERHAAGEHARRRARHRSAAADPAGGGPLPARPGAGVLRRPRGATSAWARRHHASRP